MKLDDDRTLGRPGLWAIPRCLGTLTFGIGGERW